MDNFPRISISRGLFIVTLAVATVVTSVSLLYTLQKNREQALGAAAELIEKSADIVALEVHEHILPIERIVRSSSKWPGLETLPDESGHPLRELMIEEVRELPQVMQIFMGYENGDYFQIRAAAQLSEETLAALSAPEGTVFVEDTLLRRGGDEVRAIHRLLDGNGRVLATREEAESGFEPRTRPWYTQAREAGRMIRTDVYIFDGDDVPGLSLANPFDNGVLGIDIQLAELNRFLAEKPEAETGWLAIVDKDGRILAESDKGKAVESNEGPDSRTVISKLLDAFRSGAEDHARITTIGHADWIVRVVPVRLGPGASEGLLVAEPVSTTIAPITAIGRNSALFALGLFAASIPIIWLIAGYLARPILRLVATTDQIRRLELEAQQDRSSRITEVSQLEGAMETMRQSLRTFSIYVPKTLVRQFVEAGQMPEIGGTECDVTVLFMDLENFTAMSAELEPEEVMRRMSRYFESATAILLEHHATIDKYIGDAVMAFWNAPIAVDDHAAKACEAALAICKAAREHTDAWSELSGIALRTRIGIHTGPAIIGNVGSSDRMNYTALGATVNMAARLETLNRDKVSEILVSREVVERAGDRFDFASAGEVSLRGYSEPVPIFELRGGTGERDAGAEARA